MPQTQTDKPSSPLFRQIVDHLRRQIVKGKLAEHASLPSERILAEQHNVSRMTARRALEAIEAEGLAYREGRKGRFVSPQRLNYNVSRMDSFVADAKAAGIDLQIELLESKLIKANKRLSDSLSVPIGEPLNECTRLFRIEDHAAFLETECIIAERREKLLQQHEVLRSATPTEQRFSPLGHNANIVMRLHAVQPVEAPLLGLQPHHPAIELKQIIHDETGKPFCFIRQVWRGELAQFSAQAIVRHSDNIAEQS